MDTTDEGNDLMSRNHGRLLTEILSDPDFQTLSEGAQRLYMILLPQRDLNTAGILSINYRRWARVCSTTTPERIRELAHELDKRRYVILDEDTEEAFIRSLIRRDGIASQPQMLKNALKVATQVESPRLRAELATELRRLDRDDARAVADVIDPGDPPPGGRPNGVTGHSPIQAHGSLPEPCAHPDGSPPEPCAQVGGVGEGVGVVVPVGINSIFPKIKKTTTAPKTARERAGPGFEEFYDAYPRHVEPQDAARAYIKAIKVTTHRDLMVATRRFAIECRERERRFIPYPASWLNAGGYESEPDRDRRVSGLNDGF